MLMEYPKLEELNSGNCTEKSIKIHYPDFWEYISKNYPCKKWTEKLYWFYHGLSDYPKCKVCGFPTKFINIKTGYREFCGYKCMNSCNDIQSRKKETSRRNWGTDNPMQSKKVKDKLKTTVQEKYGVDNPFQLPDFKDKRISTNLKKYGVEHHLQNDEIKSKLIKTQRDRNIYNDSTLIGYDDNGFQIRKCTHPNCDKCNQKFYITPTNIYFDRARLGYETCTILVPVGNSHKSSLETKIRQFLDEYNIKYKCNDRSILQDGKELDIYIPSHNLAIECNGIWAHSTMNNLSPKPTNYHVNKTIQCRKCGIEVLHLWEDWILYKWDIVKSIIINKLNLSQYKIYARETKIRELNPIECNEFVDANHIQGKTNNSMVRLGLFYENKLVSVMSFSLVNTKWILDRFCSKLNTNVIGGASKLLNYFIKHYEPESITSFSSNDISNGNLYKKLGFVSDEKYQNEYWYIEPGSMKRYHRSSFTKSEIVRKGIKREINDTWTEREVMEQLGFFCIYDSGQYKWVLKLRKTL